MNLTDLDSALENSIKRTARGGDRLELHNWCQMELSNLLSDLVNSELEQNGDALSNEEWVLDFFRIFKRVLKFGKF